MRVQKILPVTAQDKLTYKNNRVTNAATISQDTVSFKGGVSASLVLLVIKEGYKGLKNNSERARFKFEIAKKMSAPDLSNDAKQLVDILFALAKTKGKDEPANILYGIKDKYELKSLKTLRSEAIGKLFPLIPVKKNDINSGNAAKTAMLESMIDSGEYLESPYIYDAFKSLFNASDKESLILKAMRDKNVWREINETYVMPEAKDRAERSFKYSEDKGGSDSLFHFIKLLAYDLPKDMIKQSQHIRKETPKLIPEVQKEYNIKRAIINTTLIQSLDIRKHQDFFYAYRELIQSQYKIAYDSVAKKLKNNYENKAEYNKLYESYADGLSQLSYPEEYIAIKYLRDFSQHYKDDKSKLGQEFHINPEYSDDIIKDFELLSKCTPSTNVFKLKNLFRKRIDEKYLSDDRNIKKSAGTLVYLSGQADKLKSLLEGDKYSNARNVLTAKMNNNNAVYGCKEPHIPTLEELKKIEEEKLESFREANSSLSEEDIDMMEAHTRIAYL